MLDDLLREIGIDKVRLLPEGIVQFGNVAEVDVRVSCNRALIGCKGTRTCSWQAFLTKTG